MKFKEYVRAESLEQAYQLNQKKGSRVLGGMLWLKMNRSSVQTVIDLSGLGLDTIEEKEEEYRIGCMVTLRQLELHPGLNRMTQGAVRESVRSIVGVQFRNLATVGGSIFGRFGFSDVLTCFLALDTEVELYQKGRMPLEEFAASPRDRDILVRLIVKKDRNHYRYLSVRNTKTDFPVLTCAVCLSEAGDCGKAVIGARPGRAVAYHLREAETELLQQGEDGCAELGERISRAVAVGSNMRAQAPYRRHLAKVLVRRGFYVLAKEIGLAKEEEKPCR